MKPASTQIASARYEVPDPGRWQRIGRTLVDAETGLITSSFQIGAGPFPGRPETGARAFLASRAADFGLRTDTGDLEVTAVQRGLWADHVRFRQTIGGVPVLRSDVVVTVRRSDARIASVLSRYRPAAGAVSTTPVLTRADARRIAAGHLGAGPGRISPEKAELYLLPQGAHFPLIWRTIIPAEQPLGDWEVLVDALTGEVHGVRDQARYADGSGMVFDPDPLTTAQVPYGAPGYADPGGADATTPQLDAERVSRVLRDLTFSGGVYRLQGPWCQLVDFEAPSIPPVTSADPHAFVFDRSQAGFEDVNVYWGIDESQRYIQSLGFNNIQPVPIQCDPHGLSGADNSHYIPSSNRLAWGEGGVDDAEDQDVIWHEYGHAIQSWQVPNWGFGEADAMGEGFGDYWAGSYSASVSSYRDEWVFNWDGHNPFWNGRVLNYTAHYPDGVSGFIHTDGQMWSSTLMQAWYETSRSVVDTNTLDHHFALGTAATFREAALSWVQSDQNIYEGLNVDTWVHFATERGFLLPVDFNLPQITHTPLPDQSDVGPYTVTATVVADIVDISSVEIRWGALVAGSRSLPDGGAATNIVPMTPTGNPDEYEGDIPSLGGGFATVCYFIVAETDSGYRATHPRPAPSGGVHHFGVEAPVGVELTAVPGINALEGARPNPVRTDGGSSIAFSLARAGRTSLRVYDVAGRLVRTLVDETRTADRHAITWDGRDSSGRPVAAGVYAARLRSPGFEASRKVVVFR